MARLPIVLGDGTDGWLAIEFQPLPSDPTGLTVHVSVFPDESGAAFAMTGTTEGWQVARGYFEVLARSFVRCAEFVQARFPIGYYEDPTESPPHCSLHHRLEWLHVLMRGLRWKDQLAIDCFAYDTSSHRYVHFAGKSTIEKATQFGESLLEELASLP
jgi:hypothetical protein